MYWGRDGYWDTLMVVIKPTSALNCLSYLRKAQTPCQLALKSNMCSRYVCYDAGESVCRLAMQCEFRLPEMDFGFSLSTVLSVEVEFTCLPRLDSWFML